MKIRHKVARSADPLGYFLVWQVNVNSKDAFLNKTKLITMFSGSQEVVALVYDLCFK
jgi:hypothetical protein